MTLPLYQVDAFTSSLFAGNPAGVVPLDRFLADETLQRIAMENNLPETAFLVPAGGSRWDLRWFTPTIEVPICGHATLASAFVVSEVIGDAGPVMTFSTRQVGDLVVTRKGDRFSMRLPRWTFGPSPLVDEVAAVLGACPAEVSLVPATDDETLIALFDGQAEVIAIRPDFATMKRLAVRNVIATARGTDVDFVSRYFAPKAGIDEDPVTGSAHCSLVPYWAARLGGTEFHARQVSARGGDLFCRLEDDAVIVAGEAVLYMTGSIHLPS